jgi:hypothetical protein
MEECADTKVDRLDWYGGITNKRCETWDVGRET